MLAFLLLFRIETRAQLDYLQPWSDEGLGYYFSVSVVAEQAGNLFKTGLPGYPFAVSTSTF